MTKQDFTTFGRVSLIAIVGAVALSGCATITRGTSEEWTVTSDPAGATVSMSNGFRCDATPCTIKMPRKPGFNATVTKAGYKSVTVEVKSEMSGNGGAALAGNVLVGGLIGGVVDANNGSLNNLTPNPLNVKLEKEDSAPAPAPAPVATAPAESASSSSQSSSASDAAPPKP